MLRRYIASALIVCFFAYAAYLIITNGGKPEIITFTQLNQNINKKIQVLMGAKSELTPYELKMKEAAEAGKTKDQEEKEKKEKEEKEKKEK